MFKKVVGLVVVSVLLLSVSSSALEVRTGDEIVIPAGTVINDNLFVAGGDVAVSGTIKGDLIAFGGDIEIDAYVAGNIIVAGGDVEIKGSARNVYIGGGDVDLSGTVRKDLVVGGGTVNLGKTARVWKDTYLGCGNAEVAGRIYRDLKVGAGDLKLAPGAFVQGKLDHSADNVEISDKARVVGPITSFARPAPGKGATRLLGGLFAFSVIVGVLAILLLGVLAVVFLPNQVELVTEKMKKDFWKSLGWGILSLVVVPLVAVLLCVTLIGIPLGVLLMIVYAFGIYVAVIFASIVIGKLILDKLGKKKLSLIWALVLGFVVLKAVGWVPLLGWIVSCIVFLWAFGALVSTRFITYNNARKKGVI
jgi:cytoskeletal protein CcmA (bactofilin family)